MSAGKKKAKVSCMSISDLLAEAKAGCAGLRRTQVLPKIGAHAARGNRLAIEYLQSQNLQATVNS